MNTKTKLNVIIAYNKEYDIHEAVILDDCPNGKYTCFSLREAHNELSLDVLNNEYKILSKKHRLSKIARERVYKLIETMIHIYETHDDEHMELVFIGW